MSNRFQKEPYLNRSKQCPRCKKVTLNFFGNISLECTTCKSNVFKEMVFCRVCDLKICKRCLDEHFDKQEEKCEIETTQSCTKFLSSYKLLSGLPVLILLVVLLYYGFLSREMSDQGLRLRDLHSYFPSQKPETWHHIFSIFDKKLSTAKSLTLLHGKDDKTIECLVRKLLMVYTNDNSIKIEDISFQNVSQKVKDYGEVLEYYRPIVEKHGVFVTDLNKIPGNIARIFHSLCDESSSPIKSSLFIFILRYNESAKHLKPSKRATTILEEAWRDLPSNELFPLLSRVVKNVIDVIPEKEIKC